MSYGSSFVQVLMVALGSEGEFTVNNVMGPDDDHGNKYIPH